MNRPVRLLLIALAMLACSAAFGTPARAHSGIQSYVYVSITDSSVDGRVEFPAGDLGEAVGIDFPASAAAAEAVARANADAIRAYTADHLAMADGGGEWDLSFTDDLSILPVAGTHIVVPFTVENSFDGAPRDFRVEYDGIIHSNPERDALFLIENDWGTAQFDNEADHLLGFSVGMTEQVIELEDVGTIESMGAVRGLGTDVVREGIDHLLFVVALLLPVALVALGSTVRGPAPSVAAATRRASVLLGVFIAANSVVLWVLGLAGLEWPTDLVGSLVAGSLLVMAGYAVWRFTSRELLVVAVLGAVQGVGFAHAFVEGRLDRIDTPLALIAFNVGIEVGVVVIALLVFPVLLLLRRTALAAVALYGGAAMISAYALAWLVERVGGADLNVERVANPFRVWPRNLWLMLLAWALAGALYAWTARRGALRTVAGSGTESSEDRELVAS